MCPGIIQTLGGNGTFCRSRDTRSTSRPLFSNRVRREHSLGSDAVVSLADEEVLIDFDNLDLAGDLDSDAVTDHQFR